MMNKISILLTVLSFGFLTGCFGDDYSYSDEERASETSRAAISPSFDKEASIKAFSQTIYPLVVERCVECHSPDAALRQEPFHAHPDHAKAYNEVLEAGTVNFTDISQSIMVLRLRETKHECWSEDCNADANDLQEALEAWVSQVNAAGLIEQSQSIVDEAGDEEGELPLPVTTGENFDREASAIAFRDTVHKVTLEHCVDCHRPNGVTSQQAPFHAHESFTSAHDAVLDTARVNFSDISKSRIVLRLREDNHYCWTDNCSADADEMQSAIEAWASQIDTTSVSTVKGFQTEMLAIADAEIRLPETMNGTIVMEAESGILSGRFKIKQNSGASEYTYVGTDFPPAHPIEGTARVPSINLNGQSCQAPTAEELQNTVTGAYQIREQRRHVEQTGFRYYSQLVSVRIIRPHLRDEYRQAVLSGVTGDELERFFLTEQEPRHDDNFDGVLRGTPITLNLVRVLPQFATLNFFNNTLHGDTAEANRDFFAPKFGPFGLDYWTASDAEIRDNLADTLKLGMLYDQVIDQYRSWFFDFRGGDWVAQDRIKHVPFTLRTLLDSEGTRFENHNITSSETFYDYYLGGLTRENALDMVGGMPRIDAYVQYFINPDDRAFGDFRHNHRMPDGTTRIDDFILSRGMVNLDLANFYSGSSESDPRSIRIKNYGDMIKPIFTVNNCIQCHADGSNRPQFAQNNSEAAYDAAASVQNFFNESDPRQARPVQRMLDERHNCSDAANCDRIGDELKEAIASWYKQNAEDQLAAQGSQNLGFVALSEQERTPGRATFKVRVTEAGIYNIWLKMRAMDGDSNSFFIRVLDSEGNVVNGIGNDDLSSDSQACKIYDHTTSGDWDWYTANIDNIESRVQWTLGSGVYTIEVVEREVGADLDMIAISKNPEFNPAKNFVDEYNIQSSSPKILMYDLMESLGQPGRFEIEIIENKPLGGYTFRNPRFRGINSNVRYSNIKVLVNGIYEPPNATYTNLHRVVDGQESGLLTVAPLIALMDVGSSSDLFSFAFEDLALVDQPVEPYEDDVPLPIHGKECLNLELFSKSVMPILNNFKLIMKEDYLDYVSNSFPGNDGRPISNRPLYNCTTCHNEDHPYFKMTTFADGLRPGQPIPQDGLATLCSQALSRVVSEGEDFEKSLLLRGLNGTFNHPKLHFIQKVDSSGEGNERAFTVNNSDPSGYQSEYIGLRFDRWTADDLNLNIYEGEQLDFMKRYVGRYKQVRYQLYSNPFSVFDNVIMTQNDVIVNPGTDLENLERRSGWNLFEVINPVDELVEFDSLTQFNKRAWLSRDPVSEKGEWLWKVKEECIRENFNSNNDLLTDPCNGDVNVFTEFENLKQIYRASIINWMKEERKSDLALDDED